MNAATRTAAVHTIDRRHRVIAGRGEDAGLTLYLCPSAQRLLASATPPTPGEADPGCHAPATTISGKEEAS